MKLSTLQKYILKQCFEVKSRRIAKSMIFRFYNNKKVKRPNRDIVSTITKSVERLIKKELAVGYGWKTAHKWFIKEVRLTPKGRKIAKGLFGEQQKLPLKIKK